jgi:acetyltransferase-like isoleucine patch superfamily enzyme
MRAILKAFTDAVATLLVLVPFLAYRAGRLVLGREKAFAGWAEALSLLPGAWGASLRRAFYRLVLPRCGKDCRIGFGAVFSHDTAEVADRVWVGAYCSLGAVTLEDDVRLAPGASVMNGAKQHDFDRLDEPIREQPGVWPRLTVGRGSWVGERAVVMADVGRHCVIGPGSVVTRPVPDHSVAAGVPARVVRARLPETAGSAV